MTDDGLYAAMVRSGMSRRSFLKFSTAMAAALALPAVYGPRIAEALTKAPRLPVIWLRGQDCAGETEAFLRAPDPTAASLMLDLLSIEYHESLMAPAGAAAELSRTSAMARYPNGYVAVIEGSIPTAAAGAFCLIGGRPFVDVAREVADGALATIAVGACAFDGGAPGAGGGITGAAGVRAVLGGRPLIALPGCPVNVENLAATIVHYLTFSAWPATDGMGRPLFAYGSLIHNECERRPHFEFGEFVLAWGDEGAQKGWCLYKLGCKGPESFGNCASKRFAQGTSWPVRAGHGCIGCTMPAFWDTMSPFYRRLPSPVPFFPNVTADAVGTALVGGVGGLAVAHGAGMTVRQRRIRAAERRARAELAGTTGEPVAVAGARPGEEMRPEGQPNPGAAPTTTTEATSGEPEPPTGVPMPADRAPETDAPSAGTGPGAYVPNPGPGDDAGTQEVS
jgi:hydrogenase small subunit